MLELLSWEEHNTGHELKINFFKIKYAKISIDSLIPDNIVK
jgi:hypothetical protein